MSSPHRNKTGQYLRLEKQQPKNVTKQATSIFYIYALCYTFKNKLDLGAKEGKTPALFIVMQQRGFQQFCYASYIDRKSIKSIGPLSFFYFKKPGQPI